MEQDKKFIRHLAFIAIGAIVGSIVGFETEQPILGVLAILGTYLALAVLFARNDN